MKEDSGDDTKHTKLEDKINDVKNISSSCEKKIAEFKVIP